MTRQSEHDANRQLSDEQLAIGWKIPTTKPTRRVTLWHAAILTAVIVAASVLGQWIAIVVQNWRGF
jgi:hypothetical protein